MRAFFGDAHPYGRPISGTIESAGAVALEDVKGHYARLFRPDDAVILSAGDLKVEELKRQLDEALGDWKATRKARPIARPEYSTVEADDFRVVIVDRPGSVQTVIRWLMPGPVYGDLDRTKYELFRTILGGSFTSRLNQNLREEHGYTYGAGCQYRMEPAVGYMVAYSSVRTDVTGESVREFLNEFRGIRGANISDEETRKARSSGRMDMIQSFSGLRGIIGAASTLARNGRPFSDLGQELAAVARVSRDDLNGIANEAVPLEQSLLVLVGDKAEILPQLEGLDLPAPVELTVTGDPVGNGN